MTHRRPADVAAELTNSRTRNDVRARGDSNGDDATGAHCTQRHVRKDQVGEAVAVEARGMRSHSDDTKDTALQFQL
jgi:hypothetical protein